MSRFPGRQGPDRPPGNRTLRNVAESLDASPLVELARSFGDLDGRVLAKLEVLAPGGSSQARVARQALLDARAEGRLGAHQTLLVHDVHAEGVVQAGAILGFPTIVVVGPDVDPERRARLERYGAELEVAEGDPAACVAGLQKVTGGFPVDLGRDLSSFRAHRLGTAEEILLQSGGEVDAFCAHVHTGGTFAGCAAAFLERDPAIRCHTVRLEDDPRTELPELVDPDRVAQALRVSREAAEAQARRLAEREGLLVGPQAAAVLAGARQLLEGPLHGCTMVVVLDGEAVTPGDAPEDPAGAPEPDDVADAA